MHYVTHFVSPKNTGGLGLHHVFWAFRARYITMIQDMLQLLGTLRHMSQTLVPHTVATLRNYVHSIQQFRAYTLVTMSQHRVQARGGPGLFDEESSNDALLWKTQAKVVGMEEYTHKYVCPDATRPAPVEGVVPLGLVPCKINGILCYHNQQ